MKRIVVFLKKIKEKIKGFTLVELLAVIVILAIIMLIAIPTVLNTLETARKKGFMEYVDKAIGLAEQKYLEGTITGETSNICYIYVIESDLGLSNTGNYKGFILVAPNNNDSQYWILLYDNNYFLDVIEYKDFQNDALSKLNKLPSKTSDFDLNYFANVLKEKGVNCDSFNYNGGSIEPSNNEPGDNDGTDCDGQTVYNTVPKNASGLYKLIAEKAYMDNIKSEHVEFCNGIKITKPTYGFIYDDDTKEYINLVNGNGIGVYEMSSTKDNKYPIYYYRGEVENNYVIFANKCWRIVKTTETGGIKIVYSGNTCDATSKDASIGYQYYDTGYMNITSNLYMHGLVNPRDSKELSDGTEFLYGHDFTYNNGEYTLVDTMTLTYNSNIKSNISNYHYTCLNTTGKCSTIYWVYNIYGRGIEYYILNNGKSFDDALNEMINGTSVSSLTKQTVDKWYEDNLISYTSYIEDTTYCENKKLKSPFDAKTANISSYGDFRLWYGPEFNNGKCNKESAYSVSSNIGNGALKYPIAILNTDDLYYAGEEGGYSFLEKPRSFVMNPKFYTLISTDYGGYGAFLYTTDFWDGGGFEDIGGDEAGIKAYVRPAISLKPGVDVSSGDGTKSNPYVIR